MVPPLEPAPLFHIAAYRNGSDDVPALVAHRPATEVEMDFLSSQGAQQHILGGGSSEHLTSQQAHPRQVLLPKRLPLFIVRKQACRALSERSGSIRCIVSWRIETERLTSS